MHDADTVHRDIKPDNILVSEKCSPGPCHAKMADLGESCERSKCTGVHGTPLYQAPELFIFRDGNSRRNDVWSMGIILFQILNGGKLPHPIETATSLPGLQQVIKTFQVEAQREYKNMPASGLKALLAQMLNLDVNTRIGADECLHLALMEVKGCGFIASKLKAGERLCEPDPSKVEKLLPSCWGGSGLGDWSPGYAIKNPEVQKPPKPVEQKVEVPQRPILGHHQLPQELAVQDAATLAEEGVKMHHFKVSPGKLGAEIDDKTGAITLITAGGAFEKAQIQAGWFIDQVCGKPYSWDDLKKALGGKCSENPYRIAFREAAVAEVELPDDNEGMRMVTKNQQEGTLKVFTIQRPKINVGLGYIFKNNFGTDKFGNKVTVYVSDQGVVQTAWKFVNQKYTKKAGIPLGPGDEIISVNDEKWDDLVQNEQFKANAMTGQLGKLTFMYIKA